MAFVCPFDVIHEWLLALLPTHCSHTYPFPPTAFVLIILCPRPGVSVCWQASSGGLLLPPSLPCPFPIPCLPPYPTTTTLLTCLQWKGLVLVLCVYHQSLLPTHPVSSCCMIPPPYHTLYHPVVFPFTCLCVPSGGELHVPSWLPYYTTMYARHRSSTHATHYTLLCGFTRTHTHTCTCHTTPHLPTCHHHCTHTHHLHLCTTYHHHHHLYDLCHPHTFSYCWVGPSLVCLKMKKKRKRPLLALYACAPISISFPQGFGLFTWMVGWDLPFPTWSPDGGGHSMSPVRQAGKGYLYRKAAPV